MKIKKIKSYAKINLSLNVLGKLKNKYHKIESIFSLIQLYDKIFIKENKKNNHSIIFHGKFSKGIPKNNTVSKLLEILDKKKLLNKKKYSIKIVKKIPQKSGMAGGSMNAASLLRFFLLKNKFKISKKDLQNIARQIGSDVNIGLMRSPLVLYGDKTLIELNKKFSFHILIIKPNFGCSTRAIYKKVRKFSKSAFKKNKRIVLNNSIISEFKNDLEVPAFKMYPKLKKMKLFMSGLDKILFTRMTGSGSTIVGYFKSKKAAIYAQKILKKKYKNYWCILSKTI
tara:strand:+ start:619 stop:1467 length:849 start_codon:yes stop_codon:yes gene_type:complete